MNKKIIIIGAGPGGLQLAYYLEKNNMDYLILERANHVGHTFEYFPRHRQLISINKVYTGFDDNEINLRYDWNSLLSDEHAPLFKDYTKDYFPNADHIVNYFRDYAISHNLKIVYDAKVSNISKEDLFRIETENGYVYTCEKLVMAIGVNIPFIPKIKGIENCKTYVDTSVDPEDFINKRVLIIGKGNSGFETADNLVSTASKIHVCSPTPIKLAWKTHFVGHLRAVNNNLLDTYQLKSQNAIIDGDIEEIKEIDGEYHVTVHYGHANNEVEVLIYDDVILCAGFRFDDSMFADNTKPEMTIMNRFPNQKSNWESTNIDGLYFAGAVTQMRDFKKSTSAFIHGFRYNSKCLFHILNEDNNGVNWPSDSVSLNPEVITRKIIENVNRTSALWQQFGFIGDVIVIDNKKATYIHNIPVDYAIDTYCQDKEHYFIVTLEYGHEIFNKSPDIFNVTRVHRNDVENANQSAFLHPIVREYINGLVVNVHHIIEDFENNWKEEDVHIRPLKKFIYMCLKELVPLSL
ncbi:NAD(P)-binding domain-containing protein [Snuella sedimenti]|uniref:NAD(P)-binding domain-containing protein n=1 Tax=Snuella sedimenti TaxID=2798802 RepID=A0A8J7IZP0_9FLAO|nr:NAD(P)-binding domain-containing protein [Snuella sedimenti]MBJ6369620.1 NAD(P)-binding domain-containing protein [Snuella sedimenti]